MKSIAMIPALVLAAAPSVVLFGCRHSMSPAAYMDQHGPADVVSEAVGDQRRYYRPGTEIERWAGAEVALYYLDNAEVVLFSGGEVRVKQIPQDQLEFLRELDRHHQEEN